MLRLKVVKAAVNCVTLGVDLQGRRGARIYRARRASGPYEEVGVAHGERYVDAAELEPGTGLGHWRGGDFCGSR